MDERKGEMKILSLAQWDFAGCGYFLSDAINECTQHYSRAVRMSEQVLEFPFEYFNPTPVRMKQLINWADIVHIHDAIGLGGKGYSPNWLDTKPVVITYHGSRYRKDPKKFNETAWSRGWVATVATPDLTQFGLPWMPDCRPGLASFVNRGKDSFVIAHAPTKREIKGTSSVTGGVNKAMEKFGGITFDLIEGVTWNECLSRKGKADLTIDQFRLGYGCNAVEAWAMGQPVIGGGTAGVLKRIKNLIGYLPFVLCKENPDAIADTIEQLVKDKKFYADAVTRGVDCYETFHCPKSVAKRAMSIYEAVLSGSGIDQLVETTIKQPDNQVISSELSESVKTMIDQPGIVRVRYTGLPTQAQVIFGMATHNHYEYSGKKRTFVVDKRDIEHIASLKDNRGKSIFKIIRMQGGQID